MTTKTLFRWEQDGSGGEHGTATYWPGTIYEINVQMLTFKQAHALETRIEWVLRDARFNARRALLEQIARIAP